MQCWKQTKKPKNKSKHHVLSKLKLKHWIPGEEVSSSNDGAGGGGGWLRFFFPHGKNTLFIRFQLPLLAIIDSKRIQGNNLPEKTTTLQIDSRISVSRSKASVDRAQADGEFEVLIAFHFVQSLSVGKIHFHSTAVCRGLL